jgi:hypothetical protein
VLGRRPGQEEVGEDGAGGERQAEDYQGDDAAPADLTPALVPRGAQVTGGTALHDVSLEMR